MKLRKIRLQNIKSYVDQEITFNEGVNFISGINGAGKSTIIEAVGYALFNYNPCTVNEFLRYGTKTGTITVEFCAIDDREYRVIRKLGTSSLWAVFDLETEGELDLHGTKDVEVWLKEVLGVEQDLDLGQLFRDIVGVSQGTFVAPFLETPSMRKKKFDSILKVEQYREAYFGTREAVGSLKTTLQNQEKDLAVLASEVSDFDAVNEKVTTLKKLVIELQKQEQQLKVVVEKKTTTVNKLEQLKDDLEKISNKLQAIKVTIEGLNGRERDLKTSLTQALRAENIIKEVTQGYQAYLNIEKEMQTLEVKKQEKERLEKDLYQFRQEAYGLEASIKAKEEELSERQADFEKEKVQLEEAFKKTNEKLEDLNKENSELQKQKDFLDLWQTSEEKLDKEKNILDEIYRDITGKLDFLRGTIEKEEVEIREQLQILPQIEEKAQNYEAKEKELGDARDDWTSIRERINSLKVNRDQANNGLCPFLESPCQNVGGDLKQYFDDQISVAQKELTILKEQGAKLAVEVEEAKKAKEKMLSLEAQQKRLAQIKEQKENINKEITSLLAKANNISIKNIIEELITKALDNLTETNELKSYLQEPIKDEKKLYAIRTELERLIKNSRELRKKAETGFAEKGSQISNQITRYATEKENILKTVAQLKAKVKKAETERNGLEKSKQRLQEAQAAVQSISSQLIQYEQLDRQINNNKSALQSFRKDYETYMQNIAEAKKRKTIEQELEKLNKDIEEKIKDADKLNAKKHELTTQFNQDDFIKEKAELDQLKEKYIAQRHVLKEREEDLEEASERLKLLKRKLSEMEKLEEEMKGLRKSLDLLETVRSILNHAGGPIAKVYLENLSREANEIYRQISLDNSLLAWCSDYDITLTDNFHGRERVRGFKQFSGGEQMTAALAVRLALLKQQSLVRVGFFDEPTANLDSERRMNLAETVPRVTGEFDQLFLISHDDTFDSMTDNVIQVKKDFDSGSVIE